MMLVHLRRIRSSSYEGRAAVNVMYLSAAPRHGIVLSTSLLWCHPGHAMGHTSQLNRYLGLFPWHSPASTVQA